MLQDTAIVFIIFDGYSDLWDDAINLVKKNWPSHPPIYVFTNSIVRDWEGVTCIPVGDDAEWSAKAQKAIEVVKERFLILMLEDFYVGDKVNTKEVQSLIRFMRSEKIGYCRLCNNNRIIPKHMPKFKKGFPYEVIYQDQKYGVSLQASVWDKQYLTNLVGKDNYNAWVFEINQVKKASKAPHIPFKNCISDRRNILRIKHGALQGKMLPNTVKYFKRKNCPLTTTREVMDNKSYFKYILKHLGKDLTPQFAKSSMKKIAKRFGYSFLDEKWS